MSRIGRMPITVPADVEVNIKGQDVTVRGEKGELSLSVSSPIEIEMEDNEIRVRCPDQERLSRSLHGLTRTLISNMVEGVTQGFRKELEIVGIGYRVQVKGSDLEFSLGYSHPITVKAPEGITFVVKDQNKVFVEGIDKQKVGEAAVNIRNLRKPDPYKGKGIRYVGEHIRRKVGKAGK